MYCLSARKGPRTSNLWVSEVKRRVLSGLLEIRSLLIASNSASTWNLSINSWQPCKDDAFVVERLRAVTLRSSSKTADDVRASLLESATRARPMPTLKSFPSVLLDCSTQLFSLSHLPVTQDASAAKGRDRALLASDGSKPCIWFKRTSSESQLPISLKLQSVPTVLSRFLKAREEIILHFEIVWPLSE